MNGQREDGVGALRRQRGELKVSQQRRYTPLSPQDTASDASPWTGNRRKMGRIFLAKLLDATGTFASPLGMDARGAESVIEANRP